MTGKRPPSLLSLHKDSHRCWGRSLLSPPSNSGLQAHHLICHLRRRSASLPRPHRKNPHRTVHFFSAEFLFAPLSEPRQNGARWALRKWSTRNFRLSSGLHGEKGSLQLLGQPIKQENSDQTGTRQTADMPESIVGSVSSGSHGSHRSKAWKYRTKAMSSEIDESLFGTKSQPAKDDTLIVQKTEDRHRKAVSAPTRGRKPETIRIITSDLIRDLVVPSEDPSGLSIIMSPHHFRRIKSAARVLTKEEREMAEQAFKEEKEAAIEAVNERKNYMKQKEMRRKKNEKLSDLEEEAQQRAQYLLQRANTMRMEQEDEIKKLNEMILDAKCHAIRDAQILEKRVITKELEEETKRLDQMMEVERQKAIKIQEEIEEMRKQERVRGKIHIIQQMGENKESRLLQEEQREQESQQMLQFLEELHMQDYKDMEKKRKEQLEIQAEIKQVNADIERKKIEQKEEDKLADLRVLEYAKQKMAREAEYEAEQEKIKKEKELEVARLRALQERAQDHRAEQDALRAKRNQEAMERAWRQREKEEAVKQAEVNGMLRKARLEQVTQKEYFLAVQAQRDRAEFERVLKVQHSLVETELKEQEVKTNQLRKHASELRGQVREQEQKQVTDRISYFEEGKRLHEEARQRRARLDELKQKKLEELRTAGLPDKYCSMVARKTDVPLTVVQ